MELGRDSICIGEKLRIPVRNGDFLLTYYLLRKWIFEHQRQNREDLAVKAFAQITNEKVKEFDVNVRIIRMVRKLIGEKIVPTGYHVQPLAKVILKYRSAYSRSGAEN